MLKASNDPQVGMTEAMAVILAAEIGDKSFFVAIILAMKYDKWLVLFSSMIALSLMSISSAIFGGLISQIDHNLLQWGAAVTYREDALVTHALLILPPPPPSTRTSSLPSSPKAISLSSSLSVHIPSNPNPLLLGATLSRLVPPRPFHRCRAHARAPLCTH